MMSGRPRIVCILFLEDIAFGRRELIEAPLLET
jgi:hypothetical protein